MTQQDVANHDATRPGTVEVGQHVDIIKGQSIRLFGVDSNYRQGPTPYERTFKVGDVAAYDSYNLIYTGTITAIGAKTVTIDAGRGGSLKRLSTYKFNFFNKHFDLDRINAHNAAESQCI